MKKLLFTLPVVVLIAAGCNSTQPVIEKNPQTTTPPPSNTQTQQTTPPANTQINPAPTPTWKETVYNQFINLTDWKVEDNLSDWRLIDLERSQLNKFGKGKVVLLSKSFNQNGCQTDCTAEGKNQASLEAAVKEAFTENGWTLTAGPTEGGAYHDYLYVKDGHPLIMQVGTREAVTGGMYVVVEFLY